MKKALMVIISLLPFAAPAQVAKKVIVEHFTNTYCSICASRNPGFYSNLWHYPQVLHIAYHPSAPYAACPLSQHNKPEADARTNFYSVYGSTPRLVIQGSVISSGANYNDSTLFTSQLGQTSAFELKVEFTATSATTGSVRMVAKKVAASSLTSLSLYGAIVEDTLFFNASNGETKHYDVFRKAIWGAAPASITAPAAIGDSVVQVQAVTFNSAWNTSRIYAIAILQDATRAVVQAERSGHPSLTTQVMPVTPIFSISPNPAKDRLYINGDAGSYKVVITAANGVVVRNTTTSGSIDISSLASGLYLLYFSNERTAGVTRFIKE